MEQWEKNEEKKRYLNGHRRATRREKLTLEEIQRLRLDKMFPCIQTDGMPHGNGHSDLSDYAVKWTELMERLEKEKEDSISEYTEIRATIKKLRNENEVEVLTRRYLMQQRWENIAVEMGYDYRYTLKIHGKALDHLEIPNRTLKDT